jgi:hypothetical protein
MEKTGTPRLLIVDDSLETVDGLHSFFSFELEVLDEQVERLLPRR